MYTNKRTSVARYMKTVLVCVNKVKITIPTTAIFKLEPLVTNGGNVVVGGIARVDNIASEARACYTTSSSNWYATRVRQDKRNNTR